MLAAEPAHVLDVDLRSTVVEHHVRMHDFAEDAMGPRRDAGRANQGVLVEHGLDWLGEHLVAGDVDQALAAADDGDEAVGVLPGEVAAEEPAVAQHVFHQLFGAEVCGEHAGPAHGQLADFAATTETVRILGYQFARMIDRPDLYGKPWSDPVVTKGRALKYFVCDLAVKALRQAMDLMGAHGSDRVHDVEKHWPHGVRRLFARLRTDHDTELRWYREMIGEEEENECEEGCGVTEDIEHILCECVSTLEARTRYWEGTVTIDMMVSHPEVCRKILATRFGRLRPPKETSTESQEHFDSVGTTGRGEHTAPGRSSAGPS